ncbi:LysE family translocator [Pseudoalteromonas piscicida]|uniref:Lysine transporter LysE n=1 Tax=Pseudoalteromonas piscicida TaxID=43662 RepID=A0A2A5JUC3_PSEO7|nr:LysE family translocator [Pseudoalteromonas piscicida]PCK33000.1 lysine transporter LysE [Pseudoalteromonas piscicida]
MDYLIAVTLFAIASSVTPGPNNIMVMTSGVNFGLKRSIPLLSGICIGFSVMLLLAGLGFAALFERFPDLHFILKCVGVVYLLYLAYLIAVSPSDDNSNDNVKPFSFIKGALFQWVNAKAWIVAIGAISTYTSTDADFMSQNLMITCVFLLVSFPCVGIWLVFGSSLKHVLQNKRARKWFNLMMATLLVLSVVPIVLEIIAG